MTLPTKWRICRGRSLERGKKIFNDAGCIKCHTAGGEGAKLGPDLTDVAKRYQGTKLLDQMLNPSSEIHKEYQTHVLVTDKGKTLTGLILNEGTESIDILSNPLKPKDVVVIRKESIEARTQSKLSTMPLGLLNNFTKEEILDLLSYVQAGGKAKQ